MTLESIYYVGQTIAVFAILISLIALWVQRRQTYSVEIKRAAPAAGRLPVLLLEPEP